LDKNPIAPTTELKSLGGRTSNSENRACVDATIILKDCYIQINNQEVWRGATLQ
jgi:hypothetical protein